MNGITKPRVRLGAYLTAAAVVAAAALAGGAWATVPAAATAPASISTLTVVPTVTPVTTPAATPAPAIPAAALQATVSAWATSMASGSPTARALVVNPVELLPAGEMLTGLDVLNYSPIPSVGERCVRANITLTSPVETLPDGTQTGSQSTTPYDVRVDVTDPANPTVTWARVFATGAQAACN